MNYIKEAIELAVKRSGKPIREIKAEIGDRLYPESPKISKANLVSKLFHQNRKGVPLEDIVELCKILNITPNELFKWESKDKKETIDKIMLEVKESLMMNM